MHSCKRRIPTDGTALSVFLNGGGYASSTEVMPTAADQMRFTQDEQANGTLRFLQIRRVNQGTIVAKTKRFSHSHHRLRVY